jgi:exosome complex exonuclease RRP6
MPRRSSISLDIGLLRYLKCTATFLQISDISSQIGEFGMFLDMNEPNHPLNPLFRPLPEEMLKYARADTHFLLYIYDNLRNALLDRAVSRAASPTSRAGSPMAPDGLVREVLSRSAETALRVYSPESYDAEEGTGLNGWDTLAHRWNKPALGVDGAPGVQHEVFRAVHVWRDHVARDEDESTG